MTLVTIEPGGRLRGIDHILSEFDEETSEDRILQELDREGYPYQVFMGGVDDWLRRLSSFFQPRQLISTEPMTCHVPILEFHVPPQGTGEFVSTRSMEQSTSVGINIYGSGRTDGCIAKVSLSDKYEPRSTCVLVEAELRVKRCLYRVGTYEEVDWWP
jgi:hypothetical protein